jgi:hypothetical protein
MADLCSSAEMAEMDIDEKGNGSNAHWWKRLRNPNTLRPYLRIAEAIGIPMPLKRNEMSVLRTRVAPKQTSAIEEIVFYKPYNSQINIDRARNAIAQYLAERNLSLGAYIRDCDLIPLPEKRKENTRHFRTATEDDWYGDTSYTWDNIKKSWEEMHPRMASRNTVYVTNVLNNITRSGRATLSIPVMTHQMTDMIRHLSSRDDADARDHRRMHARYANLDDDRSMRSSDEENEAFARVGLDDDTDDYSDDENHPH